MRLPVYPFCVFLCLFAAAFPAHGAFVFGDVNGDGVVNALDIQLVINRVLGVPINPAYNPDVNHDGDVNALDIQLVINIVLGILPSSGPQAATLHVVNDLTIPIDALHIFPSGTGEWGPNLLTDPLQPDDAFRETVAPGSWDIGAVDGGLVRRVTKDIQVAPYETREVRVSEMLADEGGVSGVIGAEGGWLETETADGFLARVSFGPGAVAAGTEAYLLHSAAAEWDAQTPRWTLHIDSPTLCDAVHVAVDGFHDAGESVYFMLSDSITTAEGELAMRPQLIEAAVEDGQAVLIIPAHEDCVDAKADSRAMEKSASGIRSSFTFWAVSGYAAESSENFRLVYPTSILVESEDMPVFILASAELAYTKLKDMGFQFRADLNWPVQIDVKRRMGDIDGEVSIPLSGKANTSININENLCTPADLTELRAVIGHEFFHVVQVAHDPRSGIRIRHGWTVGYFNWLGEASSVWFEAHMIGNPNHVAEPFLAEVADYYHRGLETYTSKQNAMERGYAAAGFMRYLTEQRGDGLVLGTWEAVRAQGSGAESYSDLSALIDGVGSGFETGRQFAQYMSKLLSNTTGYPDWPVFGVRHTYAYQDSATVTTSIDELEIRTSIEPFAANRWRIYFEGVIPGNEYYLLEAVEDAPDFYYEVYRAQVLSNQQVTPLQYAATLTKDRPWHFTADPRDLLLVVAVNVTGTPPYTEPHELAVRLTRGRVYNETLDTWHSTMQDAIRGAQDNDALVAFPGTYGGASVDRPLSLRSHAGPAETVFSSGLNVSADLELIGFTITSTSSFIGGSSTIRDSVFDGDGILIQYPFIHVSNGASVTVEDTTLINGASGIRVDSGGTAAVSRCTISNNYVAVLAWDASSVIVRDNVISGNTNRAVLIGHSLNTPFSALIDGNTITGNHSTIGGGGIHVDSPEGSDVVISNNIISGNTCQNDGAGIRAGRCTIVNNIIQDNVAQGNGGGIRVGPNTVVTGNVFENNHAAEYGGGVYGLASGWERTGAVTINGRTQHVVRYAPCFLEPSNTYAANTHGNVFGAWGPGEDNWCEDAGYDVYLDP